MFATSRRLFSTYNPRRPLNFKPNGMYQIYSNQSSNSASNAMSRIKFAYVAMASVSCFSMISCYKSDRKKLAFLSLLMTILACRKRTRPDVNHKVIRNLWLDKSGKKVAIQQYDVMFRMVEYVEIDSVEVPERAKMSKLLEENKFLGQVNLMPLNVIKEDQEESYVIEADPYYVIDDEILKAVLSGHTIDTSESYDSDGNCLIREGLLSK